MLNSEQPPEQLNPEKPARSLQTIAAIVAAATVISKFFGLARQQVIAAAFGTGAAFDAFNYAYVIPGFLLILLGGINGPFHSAIVSVLAKQNHKEAGPLVETVTTLVGTVLLGLTILLVIFADPLFHFIAPGLETTPEGMEIRAIAIQQLRIMAPMAILAGFIGIGFGTLSSADHYWLPSISPLFSSVAVIVGIGGLWLTLGRDMLLDQYAMVGGAVLAGSTLAGAGLQWLVQIPPQWQAGFGRFRLRFDWNRPGVRDVLMLMAPATFSSSTLQINVFVDLLFMSYIPQAAAAFGLAGVLVQTPLGILSNVILVPLLPIFSQLAAPEHWETLKQRIRQGLLLTAVCMLPIGALMMVLATPIVRIVYERGAFQSESSQLVASLLVAYGGGMFVYLARDVMVRVFYAMGDGETPFRISLINIGLNALLDYLLVGAFGAPGLVLATVGVNSFTLVVLLGILHRRLNGLPLWQWMRAFVGLLLGSTIAAIVAWGIFWGFEQVLGSEGLLLQLVEVSIAGTIGLVIFTGLALQLKLPEVNGFMQQMSAKVLGRLPGRK